MEWQLGVGGGQVGQTRRKKGTEKQEKREKKSKEKQGRGTEAKKRIKGEDRRKGRREERMGEKRREEEKRRGGEERESSRESRHRTAEQQSSRDDSRDEQDSLSLADRGYIRRFYPPSLLVLCFAFMLFCWGWAYRGTRYSLLVASRGLPPSLAPLETLFYSSPLLRLSTCYPMLSPFLLDLYLNVLPMFSFPLLND